MCVCVFCQLTCTWFYLHVSIYLVNRYRQLHQVDYLQTASTEDEAAVTTATALLPRALANSLHHGRPSLRRPGLICMEPTIVHVRRRHRITTASEDDDKEGITPPIHSPGNLTLSDLECVGRTMNSLYKYESSWIVTYV